MFLILDSRFFQVLYFFASLRVSVFHGNSPEVRFLQHIFCDLLFYVNVSCQYFVIPFYMWQVIVSNAGQQNVKGLMGLLEENWKKQHRIFYDEKATQIPGRKSHEASHVFKPKDCMKLGFCRCEAPGKQAFVFWKKMCKSLKEFFAKGGANRSKLDSGMAVLKLQSVAFESDQPLYFHIGYINLKTWHFTLLRLQPRGPCLASGVQPLELKFDDGNLSVELAAKVFCQLDLGQVWECHLFLTSTTASFLGGLPDDTSPCRSPM